MPRATDTAPYPTVYTLLNSHLEPKVQEIEIASSLQIPAFQIIGLPGPEVSEARDRIRSAIESAGFEFPRRKVVLNHSPASVRKQGTGLDLAMAIAVALEGLRIEGVPAAKLPFRKIFAWGELGLGGRVKPTGSPARAIASAAAAGADLLFVATEDEETFFRSRREVFPDDADLPPILGISHLSQALEALRTGALPEARTARPSAAVAPPSAELSLLPLAPALERVLRIAAAGEHHFLLLGPKGAGKSHAIEWFLALQPPPSMETLRMRRYLGELSGKSDERGFRRVGIQTKAPALLGSFTGGTFRPGEFSLAHGGVLIADEFPEWSRDSREALREPLERRRVSLTRVDGAAELPSDFVFAGNGNLCACGGIPDPAEDEGDAACVCHPVDRTRYLSRMSGPILDRLDLVAVIRRTREAGGRSRSAAAELSRLREEIGAARALLAAAHGAPPGKLEPERLEEVLRSSSSLRKRLDEIPFRSFRDRHKTLRIALTLAALQGRPVPDAKILMEARSFRTQADALLRFGR
jgi:magnesium chelatase family protein